MSIIVRGMEQLKTVSIFCDAEVRRVPLSVYAGRTEENGLLAATLDLPANTAVGTPVFSLWSVGSV